MRLKVHRIIVTPLIVALTALAAFGCVSDNPSAFILREAVHVQMLDVKAMRGANTALAQRIDTRFGDWRSDTLRPESHINQIWGVRTARFGNYNPASYKVIKGDFDASDMTKNLIIIGFEPVTHHERTILDGRSSRTVAFFENSDLYVDGDRYVVRKINRLIDEDRGFMQAADDLRYAIDKVRDGALWMVASSDCSISYYISDVTDCRADAIAVTGGDEDSTDYNIVGVFTDERRAEVALEYIKEDLKGSIDSGTNMDIHQIDRSDEIVDFKITIHR